MIAGSQRQAQRVQLQRCACFGMHATHIDHQYVIDEHPHVIVALKRDHLATTVGKVRVHLTGEQEVVIWRAAVTARRILLIPQ